MPTTPDPIHEAHLNQLREQAATIGKQLAHAEYGAAARLLWQALPGAARLLYAHEDRDGSHNMVPLVLLAADDTVMWFNDKTTVYDCINYPGAKAIAAGYRCRVRLNWVTVGSVAGHLELGYDAVGGMYGPVDTADPGFFGYDRGQPLELDITAALNPYQPDPDHGYICKKCGGPSPMGVGYVADGTTAGLRSQSVKACPCSYSQTAGTMHDIPDPAR